MPKRSVQRMPFLFQESRGGFKTRPYMNIKKVRTVNFEELYKKITPILKRIARRHRTQCLFTDDNDLYQEMCVYLWNNYKNGMPENVNESYIIKGCEFHILNYLRKNRDNVTLISMEKPLGDSRDTIEDIIADTAMPVDELVDKKIIKDEIRNNGFSEKEKEAFFLLAEGMTAREAGKRMHISHVMVLKYKNRLISKLSGMVTKK